MPAETNPFPHLVIDDWWDQQLLTDVAAEVPHAEDPGWRRYDNSQERKLEGPEHMWGPWTRSLLHEMQGRAPALEELFGIPHLTMETVGGGYHLIQPGGFLDIHTDFSRSAQTGLYRRLNMLVYLNRDWTDPGGRLQLWDDERLVVEIAPEFNRTVVFATSSKSWHGHPLPTGRIRASVAAYFYSPEPPEGFMEQSTVWHAP